MKSTATPFSSPAPRAGKRAARWLAGLALSAASLGALAETPYAVEHLERERAGMILQWFDRSVEPTTRLQQDLASRRRLADQERIVLRDERLASHPDRSVSALFDNYELNFLVHASAEQRQTVIAHWLSQMGISGASLDTTREGRR